MRRIAFSLGAAVALLTASPAMATLQVNGSGQLTGVTGLVVGGSTYDVTFQDGTCAGLFSGCDAVTDFTFQTRTDAQTAGAALLAAIVGSIFDANPQLTVGCLGSSTGCLMLIPYGFNEPLLGPPNGFVANAAPSNGPVSNSNSTIVGFSPTAFDTGGNNSNLVFALFTPASAVPELSTWAMMLLGFGAIGAAMRRRKIAAVV